jgi:uncharacterized protein (TIGR02271 family)
LTLKDGSEPKETLMSQTVVGLFDSPSEAQAAVDDLTRLGIARDQISVIAKRADDATGATTGEHTKAGTGAGIGATTGAVAGGAAGILASLGLLAIPGIGWLLAAGPVVATLTGAGVGAAAGGLIGGLVGMGVPDEDAELYEEGVHRGGTLVTLQTEDALADRAAEALQRHHAVDIDKKAAEWQASGWRSRYDRSSTAGTAARDTAANIAGVTSAAANTPTGSTARAQQNTQQNVRSDAREAKIPVVEEQLQVGKRQVQGGHVRVYTRATERPVQEDVTLRRETVHVDRRPTDRPATDADLQAFKDGAIEMTESREEAVVNKQARVTGEVVVRKDVDEKKETVRDTVRKTDVQVDRSDASRADTGRRESTSNTSNTSGTSNPANNVTNSSAPKGPNCDV